MRITEWLLRPDPSKVDVNYLINATLAAAGKARAVPTGEIAAALKSGAKESESRDPTAAAKKSAAERIALGSSLDTVAAESLVGRHLDALSVEDRAKLGEDEVANATAESIAKDVTFPSANFSVECSEPSMLGPRARLAAASLAWVALVATIALFGVAGMRGTGSSGFYAAASVIGFFTVVTLLVVVMGYGKVKVTTTVGDKSDSGSDADADTSSSGGSSKS
jgi:hypothetical protein